MINFSIKRLSRLSTLSKYMPMWRNMTTLSILKTIRTMNFRPKICTKRCGNFFWDFQGILTVNHLEEVNTHTIIVLHYAFHIGLTKEISLLSTKISYFIKTTKPVQSSAVVVAKFIKNKNSTCSTFYTLQIWLPRNITFSTKKNDQWAKYLIHDSWLRYYLLLDYFLILTLWSFYLLDLSC